MIRSTVTAILSLDNEAANAFEWPVNDFYHVLIVLIMEPCASFLSQMLHLSFVSLSSSSSLRVDTCIFFVLRTCPCLLLMPPSHVSSISCLPLTLINPFHFQAFPNLQFPTLTVFKASFLSVFPTVLKNLPCHSFHNTQHLIHSILINDAFQQEVSCGSRCHSCIAVFLCSSEHSL